MSIASVSFKITWRQFHNQEWFELNSEPLKIPGKIILSSFKSKRQKEEEKDRPQENDGGSKWVY